MPRVRQNGDPVLPSPMEAVYLIDDKEEKAARLQSRQALHMRHMDELRAAASPTKKRRSYVNNILDTPAADDPYGTPTKRVPILANFEEWMKLATDNKINAANSWNFALIDYFYDMSLLKEGDGVNFQKASCTLDGCVKIYTSRVDSVATETGKLLSGLADSGNKKRRGDVEDAEDAEDEKRAKRSAEATLVNSFDQLRLKKMELEFSVDPLFKKASADFDEGGAKGLLLNHLSIDTTGRIVFDSSDDVEDEDGAEPRRDSMEPAGDEDVTVQKTTTDDDEPVDIAALASRFFPDLTTLDVQDLCPSLKTFELGSGDTSLDLPFLKAPENWRDDHLEVNKQDTSEPHDMLPDFGDDEDAEPGGWDMPDVGFGEGGEAWARDAAVQPQLRTHDLFAPSDAPDHAEVGTFDVDATVFGVSLQRDGQNDHENILNYFDTAMHKNWAGPEHWKIARIKDTQRINPADKPKVKKEKESFEIDFAAPMSAEMASALYTNASSNSIISLPKKEWKSKSRNLLPDDKHFNSKDLLKLFLKPKATISARKSGQTTEQQSLTASGDVNAAYWATTDGHRLDGHEDALHGDYDANFFADDNLPMAGADLDDDDEIFADAMEMFSPDADGMDLGPAGPGIDGVAEGVSAIEGAFGAQLITQSRRIRPEYVQYARVAKKVDVRRLKEEIWQGTGFTSETEMHAQSKVHVPISSTDDNSSLKFTDIMNNLRHVYPKQQLADISTSYGFICLLHLANEKGLIVENVDGWEDLKVRKDPSILEHELEI
ncbi:hypothetical protein AMS68_006443 [Peltaster fructicola]|uniref:Condensin complex subunit 2 n=1 Tax=Peltaster fructicola TaxID=286661 RepID=A0A6H0Y1V9_9PEZI|nr:hypothetical protein AMS68_006443 [Peltaster fructicola]